MATPLPPNQARFTVAEILEATGGVLVQASSSGAAGVGVFTDSRAVTEGSIFVALEGDKHDAHAFLPQVVAAKPSAVIVRQDVSLAGDVAVIRVTDTLRALGDLARAYTRRLRQGALRTVIGITGSVGKTSTKEMLALALSSGRTDGAVRATVGNLNNLVGVPMTLLSLDARPELAVIEMGMNVPGEIARLAEIAAPDLGIVTSVAPAHTEGVTSLAWVAEEKSALLRSLAANALGAIAPADDAVIEPWLEQVRAPLIRVGQSEGADVRLSSSRVRWAGTDLRVVIQPALTGTPTAQTIEAHLSLYGAGAAKNAATVIAAACLIGGLSEAERAASSLAHVPATPGRLAFLRGTQQTVLLDDSYNASPRAVENALETAAALARDTGGRLIAVLGDMLELGALEEELHARVGEVAARLGTSLFIACGPRMRAAAEEAREMGCDFVLDVADPLLAIEPVKTFAQRGDVILVKGSRGLRMERVVAALTSRGSSPPLEAPHHDESEEAA